MHISSSSCPPPFHYVISNYSSYEIFPQGISKETIIILKCFEETQNSSDPNQKAPETKQIQISKLRKISKTTLLIVKVLNFSCPTNIREQLKSIKLIINQPKPEENFSHYITRHNESVIDEERGERIFQIKIESNKSFDPDSELKTDLKQLIVIKFGNVTLKRFSSRVFPPIDQVLPPINQVLPSFRLIFLNETNEKKLDIKINVDKEMLFFPNGGKEEYLSNFQAKKKLSLTPSSSTVISEDDDGELLPGIPYQYTQIGSKRTYDEAFGSIFSSTSDEDVEIISETAPKRSKTVNGVVNLEEEESPSGKSDLPFNYDLLVNSKETDEFNFSKEFLEALINHESNSDSPAYFLSNSP